MRNFGSQRLDIMGEGLLLKGLSRESSFVRWPKFPDHSAEFLRLLDAVHGGASTVEDCLTTADRIEAGDSDSWYREWHATAELSKARADHAEAIGRRVTAASAFLCASHYFRVSQAFLGARDDRRQGAVHQMQMCARKYLKHLGSRAEIINLSSETFGNLEGYLVLAPTPVKGSPLVICVGGWDDFKEDHLIKLQKSAAERGISLLLVDLARPLRAMRSVRDERMFAVSLISLWMNHIEGRTDVSVQNVAILGIGLGTAFATEAASLDSRFRATVCDGGRLDSAVRAFTIRHGLGSSGDVPASDYAERSDNGTWLKRIKCPVLVADYNDRWPDAAVIYEPVGPLSGRYLPSQALAEGHSVSPPVLYECMFDWLSERLQSE